METRRKNIRLSREAYEIPFLIDLLNGWKSYTAHLLQKEIRKACEISDQNGGRGRPPYEVDARHIRRGSVPAAQNKIAGDGGPTKDQVDGFRRGSVPAAPARLWQRGFYDHALRKEEDVQKVAEYIVNNPVRMGLVEDWRNYRFSWHKWM